MRIKEIVYAPTAVEQFIYKFNRTNSTSIELVKREIIDGTPFVTIDFKNTKMELVYKFAYTLGSLQKYLAMKGENLLPLDEYPFPTEEK